MFGDIIMFLHRSRIYHAISTILPMYYSIIRPFWEITRYVSSENHIMATIQDKKIVIIAKLINEVLRFGDNDNYVYEFDKDLIKGLFKRVKYNGNLNKC